MRPSFSDLEPDERLRFGNGVGPYWLSESARKFITKTASWFFEDACWRHHDFGYVVGGDRWDRARCDWKFFAAMCRDAISQPRHRALRIPVALVTALLFFAIVRVFGQFGSFEYRDSYASIEDVRAAYMKG